MQRIAAPMVGGMLTTTLLCLLVLPLIYGLFAIRRERRRETGMKGQLNPSPTGEL
jgi:Cu(I)/Ag(I) efflux system membrane protein CusA/SilA